MTEKLNYYDIKAVSFSYLNKLHYGPKGLLNEVNEDSEAIVIGSIVDILLTDPQALDKEFYITKVNPPTSEMMLNFVKGLFKYKQLNIEEGLGYSEEDIQVKAYGVSGYSISLDRVMNSYNKEHHQKYLEELFNIGNKRTCSPEQFSTAERVVNSLKNGRFTKHLFEDEPNKTKIFQQEIFWTHAGTDIKSRLDLIIIDHEKKLICPYDIKTLGKGVGAFKSSVNERRYDIQACMYSLALYYLVFLSDDPIWNQYQDYKIDDFRFIVESTKYIGNPLVFRMSDSLLNRGLDGGEENGRKYKGFVELLDDYLWYQKNDEWEYSRETIENNGEIELV